MIWGEKRRANTIRLNHKGKQDMESMSFIKSTAKEICVLGLACCIGIFGSGCGAKEEPAQEQEAKTEEALEETAEVEAMETENREIPILRDCVEEKMGCLAGAAVTSTEIEDEKEWEIITTHFSSVTLGNELKPDALFNYSCSVCPGTMTDTINGQEIAVPVLDYSRAEKMLDKILEWNEANPDKTIRVRGHVLVWHSQTPEWFFHEDYDKTKEYADKETMDLRLEWYIKTVLIHFTGEDSRYRDLFYGWDVVNEAVSDSGGYRTDSENPSEPLSDDRHGSNSSWWHIYQSEEYIINAFRYANQYAPENLELYYNDYNECNAVKRSSIIKLLEAVKACEGEPGEGTRISAMGMQGHYGMENPSFSEVQSSIEAYGKIVENVQITELDISASSDYDGSDEAKEAEYEKQRKRYKMLYFAMDAASRKEGVNLTGITFWGTADHYSWLQNRSDVGGGSTTGLPQCPLLFDENYEPKPCFWVFVE